MSFTYDPTLPTDKDHVRFLIGDVTYPGQLQDEEIAAVLNEETLTITPGVPAIKYYAAASCLEALFGRWAGQGRGVIERQLALLRVKRGIDQSAADALRDRICRLRERGAELLLVPRSRSFSIL